MFPRSAQAVEDAGRGKDGGAPKGSVRHGTFRDVEARLPYLAVMGFDVLYLPPIHPIGRTRRKGKNNAAEAGAREPGSPWAIGSEEGGHKAVHPQLGTLEEFRSLVGVAREKHGIEVALDLAYQCSPDHPYLREHPEWFRLLPDGNIRHAENPPKKYEDIYPFDFNTPDREGLWLELKSIVDYWIEQGVRIFRVDNPHTKPFAFWEWLIGEVKQSHPEVIFLAEAFTRPKVMYRLAKCGFCQSYTYFAWKNTRAELMEYMTELTQTPVRDFFRPNFWPNTPDIVTEYLQQGGRAAFITRLVLTATLSSNYGIYGPAFELMENRPRERGSEEYLNSEKYEMKRWDTGRADSLREVISSINAARRENSALQTNRGLRFHQVSNEHIVCFSKQTHDARSVVVVAVNLDYLHPQSGWVELPVAGWDIEAGEKYQMHDVLTGARYTWSGSRNFVLLDPAVMPAHVFVPRRQTSSGREFE